MRLRQAVLCDKDGYLPCSDLWEEPMQLGETCWPDHAVPAASLPSDLTSPVMHMHCVGLFAAAYAVTGHLPSRSPAIRHRR